MKYILNDFLKFYIVIFSLIIMYLKKVQSLVYQCEQN